MGDADRAGVAVILLSYNRPTMLEMAWESIRATSGRVEVILVDDGSTAFDVVDWADRHAIRTRVFAPPRSIDRRMTQASLGRLINGALFHAHHGLGMAAVTYLCDDDLFAPGWLDAVRATLADPAGPHVMRGRWRAFDDPLIDGPLTKPRKSRPAALDVRKMTTGNFAHRAECYGEGFRWSETTVAVHDDTALWNLNALHPLKDAVDANVLAGYRREHRFNAANVTSRTEYAVGAYEMLSRSTLE